MAAATHSGIEALALFAQGLQQDPTAVKAGLTLSWSNGPVGGQITRLKLLKRQGYERAGFRLLQEHVRQAAEELDRRAGMTRTPHAPADHGGCGRTVRTSHSCMAREPTPYL
jgi:hypothetical protein